MTIIAVSTILVLLLIAFAYLLQPRPFSEQTGEYGVGVRTYEITDPVRKAFPGEDELRRIKFSLYYPTEKIVSDGDYVDLTKGEMDPLINRRIDFSLPIPSYDGEALDTGIANFLSKDASLACIILTSPTRLTGFESFHSLACWVQSIMRRAIPF